MTTPETDMQKNAEYPFLHNKIPLANGLEEYISFTDTYPGFTFCPYVAEKDPEGWDKSTSRVYMNQVLPKFLYVPVNIAKDDLSALDEFFTWVQNRKDVSAVNITQPHKSSPVLRRLYLGNAHSEINVDTLIRSNEGQLEPYDLNSTAFVEWYKNEAESFQGKPVILVGIGGVGEPIAKKIAAEQPSNLLLIDVNNKSEFAAKLGDVSHVPTAFAPSLRDTIDMGLPENVIVINAAGKEGAADDSELWELLQKEAHGGTFVDIRPHLDIEIVKEAKQHGWGAHTGHGMNARNDYVLLQGIASHIPGAVLPSFEQFQRIVAQAS